MRSGTAGLGTAAVGRRGRPLSIRLRATILATAIFVAFGIAMALLARSAVDHLVTSQRIAAGESALRKISDPANSLADAAAAVEADSFVRVRFYDADGRVMTSAEFLDVLQTLSEQVVDVAASSVASDEEAVTVGESGGAGVEETGVIGIPPTDVVNEASGSTVNPTIPGTVVTSADAAVIESSTASPEILGQRWDAEAVGASVNVAKNSNTITTSQTLVLGDTEMRVEVSMPGVGDSLALFDRTMIMLIVLLAALVAAMSWLSVSYALRPVEAIRRQVARTDVTDLSHHVPQPGTGDEVDRLATTMNDLLDRLHRASIEQKRFVSDASHELRSPVTAALATIQTVDRAQMGPGWSDIEPSLTDATVRLSKLIDDLFMMSTIDERRAVAQSDAAIEEVDLDEIALQIAERPNRCTVAVRVDRPVRVNADSRLIDRCVTNLVDNASRFATDNVLISVGLSADRHPELVVTDDGPGIADEDRDLIFERFGRLDQSRSGDSGGAGLGLAIARQIAEHAGARLVLGEGGEGGGASFHLIFESVVVEC